jgi:cell division protein FtsL
MNLARRLPTQNPVVLSPMVNTVSRPALSTARAPVSDSEARRRRPGTGVACLVLLGLTLGALAHVAVHMKHLDVALKLGEARKERAKLEEQRRQLVLEVGVLKDPVRIMQVAREKLGLAPPSAADIVSASGLRARIAARKAEVADKSDSNAPAETEPAAEESP